MGDTLIIGIRQSWKKITALYFLVRGHALYGFLACFLFAWPVLWAQPVNLGTPPILNYSRKAYGAGTQNWDAAQDSRGMMYWANNDGLLRYNGCSWTCFPVSNRTIVRSVAIDPSDRIYIGAQSDFGFFESGLNGALEYTSLVGLLPEESRDFEDVWDIVFHEGDVFFRTNKLLFHFAQGKINIFSPDEPMASLFKAGEELLVQVGMDTLLVFGQQEFKFHSSIPGLTSPITGSIPWEKDTTLLTTLKQGIYYIHHDTLQSWRTSVDPLLFEKRIYSSAPLPGNQIALGTSLEGLIVLDRQRCIYRQLSKMEGLRNNNILHTFCDRAGNVWLGLDNGIDCVVLDSRLTSLFPDGDLRGTGYAATLLNGELYFGVSNGAYSSPWKPFYPPESKPYFSPVEYSNGQVWGLQTIDQKVWMGHHEGAHQVQNRQAMKISPHPGTWTFVGLNNQYIMSGSYNGLALYRKEDEVWVHEGHINGLNESCRIMVQDDQGSIWISHPYRGLYRVRWVESRKLDPEILFYDQTSGLPSNLNNYVFSIAGKAIFGTEKGVYHFDKKENRFVPDPDYNAILGGDHRIKYLREDLQGHIWYVTDAETGFLQVEDNGVKKVVRKKVVPELTGKLVGGFEFIYPVDLENILFGAEEGFILYSTKESSLPDSSLQIIISSIHFRGIGDSLLYGGYPSHQGEVMRVFGHQLNHLVFSFAATEYKTPSLVEYRTRLEGLEDNWSAWSPESQRIVTNLGPGQYTFAVQGRIKGGLESDVELFPFRIRPPWYKTPTALALYGIGILSLFGGFVLRQRSRFETEKAQMTETHQKNEEKHIREVAESKAALTEIQNEKLEVEIKYKNQELALTTMHLVQKAELLLTVQESLNQIKEKSKPPEVKKDIQQILNLLNFDVKLDDDWQHFAHHFDQVHVDFLKHLRDKFPQLSSNDLKLCAYLRMNLSTKEIAPLLNISVRGVEGSRYRIRKKLNLPNDANLTDFILSLPSGQRPPSGMGNALST